MKTELWKRFFVLEGLDGSGTTTQLNALLAESKKNELPLVSTFEPTDRPVGKLIRQYLSGSCSSDPFTLAHLFAADRHDHLFGPEGIASSIKKGQTVLSDRYLFSSLAYQSIQYPMEKVFNLNRDFPLPECCFFLEIDPETAAKRLSHRKNREIFETIELQMQIRNHYENAFALFPDLEILRIEATLPPEEITRLILKRIWN